MAATWSVRTFVGRALTDGLRIIRSRLEPSNGTTWRALLNDQAAMLMDRPIEIETHIFPDDSPIPAISDVEAGLIDTILARLPDCIAQCERLLDVPVPWILSSCGVHSINLWSRATRARL